MASLSASVCEFISCPMFNDEGAAMVQTAFYVCSIGLLPTAWWWSIFEPAWGLHASPKKLYVVLLVKVRFIL
jgi:hypothetical protein